MEGVGGLSLQSSNKPEKRWTARLAVCTMYYMKLAFTWDENKNASNKQKHGVSFEEASTIFNGSPLEIFEDPDHSDAEDRYIAVGFSDKARALIVVHCENSVGTEIRIISARKATNKERTEVFGG